MNVLHNLTQNLKKIYLMLLKAKIIQSTLSGQETKLEVISKTGI